LDIGVLGYIGIVWPKEHSPEVSHIPPVTPCIDSIMYGATTKVVHFLLVEVLTVCANSCCELRSIRPLLTDQSLAAIVVVFNIPGETSLIGVIIHVRCARAYYTGYLYFNSNFCVIMQTIPLLSYRFMRITMNPWLICMVNNLTYKLYTYYYCNNFTNTLHCKPFGIPKCALLLDIILRVVLWIAWWWLFRVETCRCKHNCE